MKDYLGKCNYMNLNSGCSPVSYDSGSKGYEMNFNFRNQISYKNNSSASPEYSKALKLQ